MTLKLDFESRLAGKKVFVTGHTGFTGGWACLWLKSINADVAGYSLPPDTKPSLFEAAQPVEDTQSTFGDICDYDNLLVAISNFQPDLILHLAAQPLVRRSYREPIRTFLVNAQGTAHVVVEQNNSRYKSPRWFTIKLRTAAVLAALPWNRRITMEMWR